LTCPDEDKKSPEDTLKFKSLSTQSKPKDSPTYEVVVNVFCNGTPEEYIKAIIEIDKVCKGQGIDNEDKVLIMRPSRSMSWHVIFYREKH
jgi:hypothetical protein